MNKIQRLKETLTAMEGVLVAFSGGIDSTFLLWAALEALGQDRVLAATADSPIFARHDQAFAQAVAHELGAQHRFVPVRHLADEHFVANSSERCYHCKRLILAHLAQVAQDQGLHFVIEGSNLDDRDERRPGSRAVREAGIRSPLDEVGLSKAEIRALSQQAGLLGWNRPAQTCLATRFPYGESITEESLGQVEAAEVLLRKLGFSAFRVRHHGPIARIEVPADQVARLSQPDLASEAVTGLTALGFLYVTLDLAGYRRGSLEQK